MLRGGLDEGGGGGAFREEREYVRLNAFAVHLKLSQHC